jgi:glutathione S-transferase
MFYLSEKTEFFPTDKFEGAQVMQWLFFEQYSHKPFIATSRFWYLISIPVAPSVIVDC